MQSFSTRRKLAFSDLVHESAEQSCSGPVDTRSCSVKLHLQAQRATCEIFTEARAWESPVL